MTRDQIGRKRRQAFVLAVSPTIFNRHIAAVNEIRFAEAFEKSRRDPRVTLRRSGIEKADHGEYASLRARRERPHHRRTTNKRYELAPIHRSSPRTEATIYQREQHCASQQIRGLRSVVGQSLPRFPAPAWPDVRYSPYNDQDIAAP
jgi:hypothetical protein